MQVPPSAPDRVYRTALAASSPVIHAASLAALQASAQRADTVEQVERLAGHPAFTMSNPNRLRSLAGNFSMNHWAFNDASGRGYRFLADMIIAADKLNPQIAARLVPALGKWRRFEQASKSLG